MSGHLHTTQQAYPAIPIRLTLSEMAATIKAELLAGRNAGRTAVEHFVKAGQHLIEVKTKIPHGQWLPWLEANCDLSERSAQSYMSLARRWDIMTEKRRDEVALLSLREALKESASRRLPPTRQVDIETVKAEMVGVDIAHDIKVETEKSATRFGFDKALDVDFAIVEGKPEVVEMDIDADELRAHADVLEDKAAVMRRLADDPEPDPRAFTESNPKRRMQRERWRSSQVHAFDDALAVEDVEWLIARLQWQLRTGYFDAERAG